MSALRGRLRSKSAKEEWFTKFLVEAENSCSALSDIVGKCDDALGAAESQDSEEELMEYSSQLRKLVEAAEVHMVGQKEARRRLEKICTA